MLMNLTPQATQARRLLLALTCLTALAPAAWSQTTNQADAAKAEPEAKKVPVTTNEGKKDEKLVLSPFVVTTEKDSGYYAENTLMGSRMNSKISDLSASIMVVTKQQL